MTAAAVTIVGGATTGTPRLPCPTCAEKSAELTQAVFSSPRPCGGEGTGARGLSAFPLTPDPSPPQGRGEQGRPLQRDPPRHPPPPLPNPRKTTQRRPGRP